MRNGHTPVFTSNNYAAYEMRGGGFLLRSLVNDQEVFFQPGDDARSIEASVDAIDEIPDDRQEIVFDLLCSQYL